MPGLGEPDDAAPEGAAHARQRSHTSSYERGPVNTRAADELGQRADRGHIERIQRLDQAIDRDRVDVGIDGRVAGTTMTASLPDAQRPVLAGLGQLDDVDAVEIGPGR